MSVYILQNDIIIQGDDSGEGNELVEVLANPLANENRDNVNSGNVEGEDLPNSLANGNLYDENANVREGKDEKELMNEVAENVVGVLDEFVETKNSDSPNDNTNDASSIAFNDSEVKTSPSAVFSSSSACVLLQKYK